MDDVVVCDDKLVGGGMSNKGFQVQEIMNRVYDATGKNLRVTVLGQGSEVPPSLSEQDVWNRVFDEGLRSLRVG